MSTIRWHRDKAPDGTPRYFAEIRRLRVADAAMTGRAGVDDYPWDWSLTDDGVDRAYALLPYSRDPVRLRTVGVADTLRAVKEHVSALLEVRS